MAKKKTKPAKKVTRKKSKPAKKIVRTKAASKKKGAPPRKVKRAKAAPRTVKRTKVASGKVKPAKAPPSRTFQVRIDRVTQGPDGHETPADPLRVNSQDFLWIYVEADLPAQAVPRGEYHKLSPVDPTPARIPLDPPLELNGQYRFGVLHFVLAPQSKYLFHFADDLASPKYEDRREIMTI
jgi:hypothetical protein